MLSVGNLDIRDESDEDSRADHDTQDTSDNISTTATFAGYGKMAGMREQAITRPTQVGYPQKILHGTEDHQDEG